MPDWVTCAECRTRYEATSLGFCPKCGSTARSGASAPAAARPVPHRDPARMRVQLGGVLLLMLGLLFVAGAVTGLAQLPGVERAIFDNFVLAQGEGQAAGGELAVVVVSGGRPLPGANVTVEAGNQTLAMGVTDANGTFLAALEGFAAARVRVDVGNRSWQRDAFAVVGSTTEVRIDAERDPPASDAVLGIEGFALTLMVAWLTLSLLLAGGGLAATLVRWRGLALAGPLPIGALSTFALVLGLGGVLFFALVAVPYALVVSGRSAFRRR